jgi:transcriptional regulator with XRE-family HTH domain
VSDLLANKIRTARLAAGLTQAQVAERLGLSRGAVTQWESRSLASRTTPSINALKELAAIANVPFGFLLSEDSQTHESNAQPTTHSAGCWSLGPEHYECACAEIARLKGWVK